MINETKSQHFTFTLNNKIIPITECQLPWFAPLQKIDLQFTY